VGRRSPASGATKIPEGHTEYAWAYIFPCWAVDAAFTPSDTRTTLRGPARLHVLERPAADLQGCVGGRRHRRGGRGTGGETLRLERACPGQENASDARSRVGGSATLPRAGISDGRAFLIEAFITFLLVFVIISVATDKRVSTGGAVNPDP